MDRIYHGFETSLLGLALCLGLAACLTLGTPHRHAGDLSITLPTLSVTLEPRPGWLNHLWVAGGLRT